MDYEEFQEILWLDHEDYRAVTATNFERQTRWSIYKSRVFQQVSTGKFFEAHWGEGATENQEGQEHDWRFVEVQPQEITTVVYIHKPDGVKFEGYN